MLVNSCCGFQAAKVNENFGIRKLRVPGLSYGVVCMILRLAVLVQLLYRRVTDRPTDRPTDGQTDGLMDRHFHSSESTL